MIVVALKIIITQMELCLYQRQGGFYFITCQNSLSGSWYFETLGNQTNYLMKPKKGQFLFQRSSMVNLLNDDFLIFVHDVRIVVLIIVPKYQNYVMIVNSVGFTEMAMKRGDAGKAERCI